MNTKNNAEQNKLDKKNAKCMISLIQRSKLSKQNYLLITHLSC